MRKIKAPPAIASSADDTEAAFYEALQSGDIDKLMACWGDDDEIVCVYPGGPRLLGPAAIRGAFDAMFSNGAIRAQPLQVSKLRTLSASVHSVVERIDLLTGDGPRRAHVLATNVYLLTAQGWRMVAHHASPGAAREAEESPGQPALLH